MNIKYVCNLLENNEMKNDSYFSVWRCLGYFIWWEGAHVYNETSSSHHLLTSDAIISYERLKNWNFPCSSAALFYIARNKHTNLLTQNVKNMVISTLINGMSLHINDETMLRNGCLTLCQFRIPQDIVSVPQWLEKKNISVWAPSDRSLFWLVIRIQQIGEITLIRGHG